MRSGIRLLHGIFFMLALSTISSAQTPAPGQPIPPGYTLHVGTRVVLTDVTVTDSHGNPVHGLDRSAFSVLDNGKPQGIASFVEHTAAEVPQWNPHPRPGEFSNGYLQHPPPASNVLLLDITTIHIEDQMYLLEQLEKFLGAVQPNELMAVYTRAGDSVVLLQDFTSDPTLLREAVARAIPRLQQPGSWAANEMDTLLQMVTLLRPYPGRKNLMWFSGGSNLALMADAGEVPAFVNMQPIYDALEIGRIAVYPIDARGLTYAETDRMAWQQILMQETAQATGGQAYFNSNGLRQIAARIVDTGADFYTLTYSPSNPAFDNKWHKVKVVVRSGGEEYQLSYRRGYFDDGNNLALPAATRTALRPASSTGTDAVPDVLKAPLLFSATVLPAAPAAQAAPVSYPVMTTVAPRKNETTYDIHYSLRAADLVQSAGAQPHVTLGTGVVAVNRLGSTVARQMKKVQLGMDPDKLRSYPNGQVEFDLEINLPKGDDFLYLTVWDGSTGRVGMIQAPLSVPKRAVEREQ